VDSEQESVLLRSEWLLFTGNWWLCTTAGRWRSARRLLSGGSLWIDETGDWRYNSDHSLEVILVEI